MPQRSCAYQSAFLDIAFVTHRSASRTTAPSSGCGGCCRMRRRSCLTARCTWTCTRCRRRSRRHRRGTTPSAPRSSTQVSDVEKPRVSTLPNLCVGIQHRWMRLSACQCQWLRAGWQGSKTVPQRAAAPAPSVAHVQLRFTVTSAGYRVSGTHANPLGIKTDAPWDVIWDVMRAWVADHPVKAQVRALLRQRIMCLTLSPPGHDEAVSRMPAWRATTSRHRLGGWCIPNAVMS